MIHQTHASLSCSYQKYPDIIWNHPINYPSSPSEPRGGFEPLQSYWAIRSGRVTSGGNLLTRLAPSSHEITESSSTRPSPCDLRPAAPVGPGKGSEETSPRISLLRASSVPSVRRITKQRRRRRLQRRRRRRR